MAELARDVIRKALQVEVTQDEVGFIAAYFGVFISEQQRKRAKYIKLQLYVGLAGLQQG